MIRFQSKVTADLVMFNEHGSVLLEIWGKTPGAKGILLAAEMAEADAAVRDFIGRHGAVDHKAADNNAGADQASKPPPVSWSARFTPLLKKLARCQAEDEPLTWEMR